MRGPQEIRYHPDPYGMGDGTWLGTGHGWKPDMAWNRTSLETGHCLELDIADNHTLLSF